MIAVVCMSSRRCGTVGSLVEQSHTLLELSNLLGLDFFVHTFALQTPCASTLSRTISLWRGRLQGPDDNIVKSGEYCCGQHIDLEFDLFRALQRISKMRKTTSKQDLHREFLEHLRELSE